MDCDTEWCLVPFPGPQAGVCSSNALVSLQNSTRSPKQRCRNASECSCARPKRRCALSSAVEGWPSVHLNRARHWATCSLVGRSQSPPCGAKFWAAGCKLLPLVPLGSWFLWVLFLGLVPCLTVRHCMSELNIGVGAALFSYHG